MHLENGDKHHMEYDKLYTLDEILHGVKSKLDNGVIDRRAQARKQVMDQMARARAARSKRKVPSDWQSAPARAVGKIGYVWYCYSTVRDRSGYFYTYQMKHGWRHQDANPAAFKSRKTAMQHAQRRYNTALKKIEKAIK